MACCIASQVVLAILLQENESVQAAASLGCHKVLRLLQASDVKFNTQWSQTTVSTGVGFGIVLLVKVLCIIELRGRQNLCGDASLNQFYQNRI